MLISEQVSNPENVSARNEAYIRMKQLISAQYAD